MVRLAAVAHSRTWPGRLALVPVSLPGSAAFPVTENGTHRKPLLFVVAKAGVKKLGRPGGLALKERSGPLDYEPSVDCAVFVSNIFLEGIYGLILQVGPGNYWSFRGI